MVMARVRMGMENKEMARVRMGMENKEMGYNLLW